MQVKPPDEYSSSSMDCFGIGESYTGQVSLLTASFAQQTHQRMWTCLLAILGTGHKPAQLAKSRFAGVLVHSNGALLCNRAAWYDALAVLPLGRRLRVACESAMGLRAPFATALSTHLSFAENTGPVTRLRNFAGALRCLWALGWRILFLRRSIVAFRQQLDAALALDADAVSGLSLSDLALEFRRLETDLLERWDAPLVNAIAYTLAYGLARRLFRRWFGRDGAGLLVKHLLAQRPLATAEPMQRIDAMAALAADDAAALAALHSGELVQLRQSAPLYLQVTRYLAKFGESGVAAFKFESQPLSENPAPLLRAIAAVAARAQNTPLEKPRPEDRLAELCAGKPLRHLLARRLLRYAGARLRDREVLRLEQAQLMALLRRLFLSMGAHLAGQGWLDRPQACLALSVADLTGAAQGTLERRDLRVRIAENHRTLSVAAATGPALPPQHDAPGITSRASASIAPYQGLALGGGQARGVVRYAGVGGDDTLAPGTILVVRYLDPGAIAANLSAAAIILEDDDPLSHSAIIARSLGIACVGACRGATQWLAQGDLVAVDGTAGTFRLLAPGDAGP